ncbi:hypothetical protein IV203_009585 [Nitzschia inconspicua]|uniref:Uncharacterized protein n=1 Tax=Nitzschia inconspicua TaxID=303405 RepID=A0A9K3KUJ3_9STRA|nr:hypothetical protein IV203_009585 [Nitzschia inconspicua]
MDTTSSANAVVGKSTRRQNESQRLNARDQERAVKWSEMPKVRHLTEYCLMKAKEEWDVANTLVVIHAKMDPGEWWVFDSMMADEFERDNKNGEVINIEGMDFLSEQPESWLSIQDDNNTLVAQGKHLHELTWVQKKVALKGVPLPEIRMTVETAIRGANDEQEPIFEVGTDDDQEPMFEVECHIPDTIHNLQVSQQNAVTSLRHQKNAADAQVTELFRTALNLAGQRSGHIELLKDHLQEVIRKMNSDIASGNEHHKRSSGYAFPEMGRSNKRVEKRKKSAGEF